MDDTERIKEIKEVIDAYGFPCPLFYIAKKTGFNYKTLKRILTERMGYKISNEVVSVRRKTLVISKL